MKGVCGTCGEKVTLLRGKAWSPSNPIGWIVPEHALVAKPDSDFSRPAARCPGSGRFPTCLIGILPEVLHLVDSIYAPQGCEEVVIRH